MVPRSLFARALHIVLLAKVATGATVSPTCDDIGSCDSTSLLQVKQTVARKRAASAAESKLEVNMEQLEINIGAPPRMQYEAMQKLIAAASHIVVKPPAQTTGHALKHHTPADTDLYLMDPVTTNRACFGMAIVAVAAVLVGGYFSQAGSTFPPWMVATLVVCYMMWGVGIFVTNSSMFMLWQGIMGDDIITTKNFQNEPPTPGVMRESPSEMIRLLNQSALTSVKTCGVICSVLAFIAPLARLFCLLAGEYWRQKEATVQRARICLMVVQRGSKWACPVFLLMIMTHCQFLAMDNGNDVMTKSTLEIGWMGYFLFCVTNLTIALSIVVPEVEYKADEKREAKEPMLSKKNLAYAVAIGGCCYLSLLAVSIFKGTFSYDLQLPPIVWLGVPPSVHATVSLTQVSIWQCITMLLTRSFHSLQLMPFLAAMTLLVFLVILPILDMCALVLVCSYASEKDLQNAQLARAQKALAISSKIRYCLLTDVLVFAFYLMSISGMFALHEAVLALCAAEGIRYIITYGVVEGGVGIADYLNKEQALSVTAKAKSTPWVEWDGDGGRWKVDRRRVA